MTFKVNPDQINPIYNSRCSKYENNCCGSCEYYKKESSTTQVGDEMGDCRYNPPSSNGHPKVFSTGWCGQYKNKMLLG